MRPANEVTLLVYLKHTYISLLLHASLLVSGHAATVQVGGPIDFDDFSCELLFLFGIIRYLLWRRVRLIPFSFHHQFIYFIANNSN